MKFLALVVPATLVMGVVAMPTPSTSKAARLSGENLLDGLANDGGLSGFLSGVHLPFLNPSPKKDTQDPSDEDPDDVPARDDKGPGADDDNNGDGPADPIYGSEDSAGVGAGTQDGAEK
ncbi:hypothetical protein AtubIFM56815_010053 [Aspergillus tubingensis]|uniref:Uncharacterized protein n=2 Tax=Aspergillus subgen. Circumdati TaxID=2720871 RepID=A0A100I4Z5_ASPNG|nr:putative methyltransferase family protein [Aspergillus tubingensis]GAQ34794.1 hypothetical protein AKAW_00432 [Aspergillus niger]GFN16243.1 putative methyltransferase family protein [Aspergillus tubingensis]GLA60495.1 hypothetical protein AtubIFM54640_000974 [Aspergillus tubingensis]GLA85811.1 hypothetical protein AtubIFM56815_010053 [Aspergillus tubingensis]